MSRITLDILLQYVIEEKKEEFIYLFHRLKKTLPRKDEELDKFFQLIEDWAITHWNITGEEILGQSRLRDIVAIRTVSMYAMRRYFEEGVTLERIGKFYKKNHSSIIHSCRKVEEEIEYDFLLKKLLVSLHNYLAQKDIYCLAFKVNQLNNK